MVLTLGISFLDVYTSTTPGQPAFFGNRSIVIHNKSNQRIACANFHPVPMPPFGSGESTFTLILLRVKLTWIR